MSVLLVAVWGQHIFCTSAATRGHQKRGIHSAHPHYPTIREHHDAQSAVTFLDGHVFAASSSRYRNTPRQPPLLRALPQPTKPATGLPITANKSLASPLSNLCSPAACGSSLTDGSCPHNYKTPSTPICGINPASGNSSLWERCHHPCGTSDVYGISRHHQGRRRRDQYEPPLSRAPPCRPISPNTVIENNNAATLSPNRLPARGITMASSTSISTAATAVVATDE